MAAEVGGHGRAIAFGQEPFSEQYDDRHRSRQQRQADKREFEEAEAAHAGVAARVRDQDVHRRAGQSQLRAGMRGKNQRHEQLRRISLQADGDDDHHRQERGHGAIDADQRRKERDHAHRQQQQASAALFARAADQKLPRPGGDACHVQSRADDEERGYEDDRGIAEAAEGLIDRQDAGCPQRQRSRHRDNDDRQLVPDEQDDDDRDDGGSVRYRAQSLGSSPALPPGRSMTANLPSSPEARRGGSPSRIRPGSHIP